MTLPWTSWSAAGGQGMRRTERIAMTISESLTALRTKAGLTQQAVAEGAGMCLRAYQNYERGLREPKINAAIALADFYNISLDELVCRDWPGSGKL